MHSKCDLCGSFSELNSCPSCGRFVCGSCFDLSKELCIACAQSAKLEEKDKKDYIE